MHCPCVHTGASSDVSTPLLDVAAKYPVVLAPAPGAFYVIHSSVFEATHLSRPQLACTGCPMWPAILWPPHDVPPSLEAVLKEQREEDVASADNLVAVTYLADKCRGWVRCTVPPPARRQAMLTPGLARYVVSHTRLKLFRPDVPVRVTKRMKKHKPLRRQYRAARECAEVRSVCGWPAPHASWRSRSAPCV